MIVDRPHAERFASAICDALGLKRVTKLTLTFEVGEVPKVEAICLVHRETELNEVLRSFTLTATEVAPGGADIEDAPVTL